MRNDIVIHRVSTARFVIADRSLDLPTAPNFRDAGGYLETLTRDHVRLVCDLRTDQERATGMDRFPAGAMPLIADVLGSDNATFAQVRDAFSDSAADSAALPGSDPTAKNPCAAQTLAIG